jgi:hypothetical protein
MDSQNIYERRVRVSVVGGDPLPSSYNVPTSLLETPAAHALTMTMEIVFAPAVISILSDGRTENILNGRKRNLAHEDSMHFVEDIIPSGLDRQVNLKK